MNDTSRREFVAVCSALSISACSSKNITAMKISIGKTTDFKDGVSFLDFYRIVLRKRQENGKVYLSVMSKLCTHQSCLLNQDSTSYLCPCHGSQFSEKGVLIKGPAKENLPYYKLYFENQQVFVNFSEPVDPAWELECV